jgi:regulatory protein
MNDYLITNVELKKNKLYIEMDGVYHLFLYESDIKKERLFSRLKEGERLTSEEVEVLDTWAITRGKRRVMYLLAKQDYPKAQLETKLQTDGYNLKHIGCILKSFEEKGYVNDERLANQKVSQYKNYKSRREIEYVLRNKGFESAIVKESIKQEISDESELESALYLVRKKFDHRRYQLELPELRKKIFGFLARKGYTANTCQKVLKSYLNQGSEDFFDVDVDE